MAVKAWIYVARWTHKGKSRKAYGIGREINGKVVRKIVADTKAGAQDELARLRERERKGLSGIAEGKTFADLAPKFLTFKEQMGRDMQTIRSRVNNLSPYFGNKLLSEIDAEAIDGYVAARCAEYKTKPCKKHKGEPSAARSATNGSTRRPSTGTWACCGLCCGWGSVNGAGWTGSHTWKDSPRNRHGILN